MKDGCGNCRDEPRKFRIGDISQEKINTLLEDLLEKEEEIALYKNRLKELEAAFYYNLELISERDLELSVLEKQLADENEQLKEVCRERNELEDLIKTIDEKNHKKIHQLEARLTLKEEEIRNLQRDNLSNVSTLKGIIDGLKLQEEKKLTKMTTKFEMQKNELIKDYQEKIEQRESYYLLEIDNLSRKLDQARREKDKLASAEEEIGELKRHLEDAEKVFLEKEHYYLEKMRRISKSYPMRANKEVQCGGDPQRNEKTVQAEPDLSVADSQTSQEIPQREDHYEEKISFLQEQNEVLKFIIKDLKRNREGGGGQPPGCECLTMRADVEQVNKKFQGEISNLKKILEKELKSRAEEDAVIQSMETSVTCLKDKLLLGLQEKLRQFSGDDIRVTLLEQKLSQKIDSLISVAEEDRQQRLHAKLEELRNECFRRIDAYLKSRDETSKSDSFLERIRMEMQQLENKIEADVRNMLASNRKLHKCYKNVIQENQEKVVCKETRTGRRLGERMVQREFINNLIVGR